MKACMETDKPLISVVMAVYNPRMDWFIEQLISLNNQSYNNLELLVLDDCSSDVPFREISAAVKTNITDIQYKIFQNDKNIGSTKTFEILTSYALGEYIAYCDQDDIWHPDKIQVLLGCFKNKKINLAFSDAQIIDENGNKRADSITEVRPRHILYEGCGLSQRLVIQNFVLGCTMLIKRNIAQKAIPFIDVMVHDHYLALMASLDGELALSRKPLISYRIHSDNQTNTLAGIKTKEDYYNNKIKKFLDRIYKLEYRNVSGIIAEFNDIKKWVEARDSYYKGAFECAKIIWTYRRFNVGISLFELVMLKMPNFLFEFALEKIKKG